MPTQNEATAPKRMRGFAYMKATNPDKLAQICKKGGVSAHALGKGHTFSPLEASAAAKKAHNKGTAHHFTPEEARAAGAKGGRERARRRGEQQRAEQHSRATSPQKIAAAL